jgi:hypothetical protein
MTLVVEAYYDEGFPIAIAFAALLDSRSRMVSRHFGLFDLVLFANGRF